MSQHNKSERKQCPACARGVKCVEIVKLIKTVVAIGSGTDVDPNRLLTQYWTVSGDLLWTLDAIQEDASGDES